MTALTEDKPDIVPHFTVAERIARGKAARAESPRSTHARFEPASDRADPLDLLEQQAKTRVPDLVPIRYGRMLVSPFTFYRGAAKIMADDLERTPRSGLTVQCCGDAHLSNFGLFASPELERLLRLYRESLDYHRRKLLEQFTMTDFARKVVGVGSVGTRAWIALLFGRDENDPLFLQVKEAEASVLEDSLGPSEFSNHGQRVVVGQRLMQATSDIFLGWVHVESPIDGKPRDFYGRQLKDWKGSIEIDQLRPEGLVFYGVLCGRTLARAHARSGDRIAIASYLGNSDRFDRALLEFSMAYADQNEHDYRRMVAAVDSGQIKAVTGL